MPSATAAGRYWAAKRKRSTTRKTTGLSVNQRKSIAKIATRVIHRKTELKFADASDGGAPITNADASPVFPITDIPIGTTDQNARIGDKIELKDVELNMQFNNQHPTGAGLTITFRVIVFQYYSDDTAALPTNLTVLSAFGASYDLGQPLNQDQRRNFGVLKDFYVTVGNAANGLSSQSRHMILRPKRKMLNFVNGTQRGYNRLYFLITCDDITTPTHSVFYNLLTRYYDA